MGMTAAELTRGGGGFAPCPPPPHGAAPAYQYPSLLIINSSDHQQFLCWGTSRSAKWNTQFLRSLIFIPFTKEASAHPSMNYFQICWCHMIDETSIIHTYVNFSKMFHIFLFGTIFKSVNFFFETLGIYRNGQCHAEIIRECLLRNDNSDMGVTDETKMNEIKCIIIWLYFLIWKWTFYHAESILY